MSKLERIDEYIKSIYQLNQAVLAKILISYQRKPELQFWLDGQV